MNTKPFDKVLCKRTLTIGKDHYWDEIGSVEPLYHPKRHERENRMLIKGQWYKVTKWKDNSFWIIDSQGSSFSHRVYSEEEKKNFPSYCDVYGPRDYEKWFYTPEELKEIDQGTYKQSFKDEHAISVFPGNYHWVKQKEKDGGKWIVALCSEKEHPMHGIHWWKIIGCDIERDDFDFEEIGHQVDSMETQEENKEKIEDYKELNDTLFPLVDSLINEGTKEEKYHAPVGYHKSFVENAIDKYFDKSFGRLRFTDTSLFDDE